MQKRVLIVGGGQHCKVVIYNMRAQNIYQPVAIADTNKELWGTTIDSIPILADYEDFNPDILEKIKHQFSVDSFFIGLGNMKIRQRLFDFFISQGWHSVNIIHPNAVVSATARLGVGILIEAGCLITPSPIIGNNVVINTGSQVNHDNVIADHVYIASGVILSGGVTIGRNTLIDDGVIIALGNAVGSNCIIGAGSVVTKDFPDGMIGYGNPCKVIRENLNI